MKNYNEIISKIKEFYGEFILKDNKLYIADKLIKPDVDFTFAFGHDKSDPNFKNLIKSGDVVVINTKHLYKEFGISEEAYFKLIHGYGYRTKRYLEKVFRTNNFVSIETYMPVHSVGISIESYIQRKITGFKAIEIVRVRMSKRFPIYKKFLIGRVEQEYYAIYETTDGDELIFELYKFNKLPSKKNIRSVIKVCDLKSYFKYNPILLAHEIYKCRLCGKILHWLDAGGNFEEKYSACIGQICTCRFDRYGYKVKGYKKNEFEELLK